MYQGDKEWVAIQIVSVLSGGPVGPEAQLEIQAALQIACPTYHVPTAQLRKHVLYSHHSACKLCMGGRDAEQ